MKIVTAEELKNQIATGSTLIVINVLPKKYYDDCHISGSINIPLEELGESIKEYPLDTSIVTYCANITCSASGKAAELLQQLGYTNVVKYSGGMKEWHDLGYSYKGLGTEKYLKCDKL